MKKKIALLLAAVMVVGSLPMTAFASTENTVSSIKTVEDGDPISAKVFLEEFKGISGTELQTVKLTLTNAKFVDEDQENASTNVESDLVEDVENAESDLKVAYDAALEEIVTDGGEHIKYAGSNCDTYEAFKAAIEDADPFAENNIAGSGSQSAATSLTDLKNTAKAYIDAVAALATAEASADVKYTKISDTEYMAEFYAKNNSNVTLAIEAEADGSGDATVTLEAVDSVVSSQTLKIANIAGGATTTTISGTTSIRETATEIKSIVITETTAGSLDTNPVIKLKLSNGFTWSAIDAADADDDTKVVVFPSNSFGHGNNVAGATMDVANSDFYIDDDDASVAYISLTGSTAGETAATISLQNVAVQYDEDDVEVGDECEVTVSEAGTTKQSVVIGTAADYGVSFSVEDKDLPTFYAGRYDDEVETLNVTIKENIADSWLEGRKTKIVFPEGVEVVAVNEEDTSKVDAITYTIDENEVAISGLEKSGKAEVELNFELSVAADFTGDIEATLTGSGVGDDQTVTVGTAVFPVTVDADVNELKIDYRNTAASDIVITEADAGVLEKGKTVSLYIDGIDFDGDPTVEVESGDMKIENVRVTRDGELQFTIKTASQKEAAVIRVSDIELYMQRSLPAGEYDLVINNITDNGGNVLTDAAADAIAGDAVIDGDSIDPAYVSANVSDAIIKNYSDSDDSATGLFDVDEVTAKEGYVTVVTAGRDQGDETFTTTVTVTIGADKMYAGTKEIALDVPAYISNGYTMMPVRAVTEALSGAAIVRWDDPTKTVTITFGQRVISMTVGSNVMKINGVDVAMQAQCEITDSRAFIPLRDLGYALGLNDSKIGWDDATKTAKLN